MKRNERKANLLKAGLLAAEEIGYNKVTRITVAERANVSESLVQFYFRDMDELREALIVSAVDSHNLPVLAQAIGALHPTALNIPRPLFRKIINFLINHLVQ